MRNSTDDSRGTDLNRYAPPRSAHGQGATSPEQSRGSRASTVYSGSGIVMASVLGGPLAVGFMICQNLLRLNARARVVPAAATFSVLVALWVYVGFNTPEDFLSQLIPVVPQWVLWVILAICFVRQPHRDYVSAGGRFASNWRALAVGLRVWAVLMLIYAAPILVSHWTSH